MKKLKQWDECKYSSRSYKMPILRKGIYVATIPKEYRKNQYIHIVIRKDGNIERVKDVFPVKKVKKAPTLEIDGKQYKLFKVEK